MSQRERRHLYLAMDITNRCNLRCPMCARTALPPPASQDLTLEQFRTIGDHCFHRAVALALSCSAEPLLHRSFCQIVEATDHYRVPFTEVVTNGILLDENKIEAIIDARISRIVVSIDGATAPTYESIRVGADFERLLSNLRLLQAMKEERRASHPILRLNVVMMRRNIEELPALIELAAGLGASQVTAQHMAIYEGGLSEDESLFWHQEPTNRQLTKAHRLAARAGITFNAPPLFSSTGTKLGDLGWLLYSRWVTGFGVLRQFGRARLLALARNHLRRRLAHRHVWCHHPWEIVFVDPRADVRPCVNWGAEPPLGNCLEQPLEEIWNGPAYAQLRDELAGKSPLRQACLHCPAVASGKVDDLTAFQKIRH
jgi:radical SAM protein with 4Fe4S-binding SPASM domain